MRDHAAMAHDSHRAQCGFPQNLPKNSATLRWSQLLSIMATQISAGILLYRIRKGAPEVFLVHPGGPYWRNKDVGAWSIPKGMLEAGDDELMAAKREFQEETGSAVDGEFVELMPLKQPSGKVVHAWAVQGDIDASSVRSNLFPMEWPPRSGKMQDFPEVDRGGWFTLDIAREKILNGQRGFLDQLERRLKAAAGNGGH